MMATKKTKEKFIEDAIDPIVTIGSHSIRKEYADGRVEFESDWDKLKADVEAALATVAKTEPKKPAKKTKKAVEPVAEEKPKKKAAAKKEVVAEKPKKAVKKKTK